VVAILFYWLFDRFLLRCYCCRLEIFRGFIGLWTHQNSHWFRYVHIQCKFKVYFIVLLVDFKKKICSWWHFLLFFINFFDHFLSYCLILKFKNIIYRFKSIPELIYMLNHQIIIFKYSYHLLSLQDKLDIIQIISELKKMLFSLINPYFNVND
jgi:hypothetical protein